MRFLILLDWLPRIDNLDVKEEIVRALSVTWAKPIAAPALVREFLRSKNEPDNGLRWTIANALSVVADDSVFGEIVNLVRDPQHGRAREMLAVSLSNMKDPEVEGVLIDLLDDEVVAGHAIIALGKLKSQKAYQKIEQFLTHPKPWVRKEAKKALIRIENLGKNRRSRKYLRIFQLFSNWRDDYDFTEVTSLLFAKPDADKLEWSPLFAQAAAWFA